MTIQISEPRVESHAGPGPNGYHQTGRGVWAPSPAHSVRQCRQAITVGWGGRAAQTARSGATRDRQFGITDYGPVMCVDLDKAEHLTAIETGLLPPDAFVICKPVDVGQLVKVDLRGPVAGPLLRRFSRDVLENVGRLEDGAGGLHEPYAVVAGVLTSARDIVQHLDYIRRTRAGLCTWGLTLHSLAGTVGRFSLPYGINLLSWLHRRYPTLRTAAVLIANDAGAKVPIRAGAVTMTALLELERLLAPGGGHGDDSLYPSGGLSQQSDPPGWVFYFEPAHLDDPTFDGTVAAVLRDLETTLLIQPLNFLGNHKGGDRRQKLHMTSLGRAELVWNRAAAASVAEAEYAASLVSLPDASPRHDMRSRLSAVLGSTLRTDPHSWLNNHTTDGQGPRAQAARITDAIYRQVTVGAPSSRGIVRAFQNRLDDEAGQRLISVRADAARGLEGLTTSVWELIKEATDGFELPTVRALLDDLGTALTGWKVAAAELLRNSETRFGNAADDLLEARGSIVDEEEPSDDGGFLASVKSFFGKDIDFAPEDIEPEGGPSEVANAAREVLALRLESEALRTAIREVDSVLRDAEQLGNKVEALMQALREAQIALGAELAEARTKAEALKPSAAGVFLPSLPEVAAAIRSRHGSAGRAEDTNSVLQSVAGRFDVAASAISAARVLDAVRRVAGARLADVHALTINDVFALLPADTVRKLGNQLFEMSRPLVALSDSASLIEQRVLGVPDGQHSLVAGRLKDSGTIGTTDIYDYRGPNGDIECAVLYTVLDGITIGALAMTPERLEFLRRYEASDGPDKAWGDGRDRAIPGQTGSDWDDLIVRCISIGAILHACETPNPPKKTNRYFVGVPEDIRGPAFIRSKHGGQCSPAEGLDGIHTLLSTNSHVVDTLERTLDDYAQVHGLAELQRRITERYRTAQLRHPDLMAAAKRLVEGGSNK